MPTKLRVLQSEFLCEDLRNKLSCCGATTVDGYHRWCRSVFCDACRRRRARTTADLVANWAVGVRSRSRLYRIDLRTADCDHAGSVVAEIQHIRRKMAEVQDNLCRTNARWMGVRQYGYWVPCYDASHRSFYGKLRGIVNTDLVGESNYIDAFIRLPIRRTKSIITPFMTSYDKLLSLSDFRSDIYDWITIAMTDLSELDECGNLELGSIADEVFRAGESKALLARRGFAGAFAQ